MKGTVVRETPDGPDIPLTPSLWEEMRDGLIEIRPVLKPVSRLTENQMDAIFALVIPEGPESNDWIKFRQDGDIEFIFYRRSWLDVKKMYDYLIQEGYDVCGLIEQGLAYDGGGN